MFPDGKKLRKLKAGKYIPAKTINRFAQAQENLSNGFTLSGSLFQTARGTPSKAFYARIDPDEHLYPYSFKEVYETISTGGGTMTWVDTPNGISAENKAYEFNGKRDLAGKIVRMEYAPGWHDATDRDSFFVFQWHEVGGCGKFFCTIVHYCGGPILDAIVTIKDMEDPPNTIGTCTTGWIVTTINVTNQGTGYESAPDVDVSGPGWSDVTAVANVVGRKVTSITVTGHGSGTNVPPIVTITGGKGSGATAIAGIDTGCCIEMTEGGTFTISVDNIPKNPGESKNAPYPPCGTTFNTFPHTATLCVAEFNCNNLAFGLVPCPDTGLAGALVEIEDATGHVVSSGITTVPLGGATGSVCLDNVPLGHTSSIAPADYSIWVSKLPRWARTRQGQPNGATLNPCIVNHFGGLGVKPDPAPGYTCCPGCGEPVKTTLHGSDNYGGGGIISQGGSWTTHYQNPGDPDPTHTCGATIHFNCSGTGSAAHPCGFPFFTADITLNWFVPPLTVTGIGMNTTWTCPEPIFMATGTLTSFVPGGSIPFPITLCCPLIATVSE